MDVLNDMNRKEEARRVFEQRTNRGLAWKREEDNKERTLNERRATLRREAIALYRDFLRHLWRDEKPGEEELALLKAVGSSLAISEKDRSVMDRSIRFDLYADSVRSMLQTVGFMQQDHVHATAALREQLNITLEQHTMLMENLLSEKNGA
jgi:hypothetical protein